MIRNFLFSTFFFSGLILILILFIPSFILPQKFSLFGGKLIGYWSKICLQVFLSTKITIKGKENVVSKNKFFIASSHQSMFETFFLQTIFNSPVFILKKELLLIPLFGWYLKKIGSITIKRNKVTKDNSDFLKDISRIINTSNRPLIIFPQATRVLPSERPPFKKGSFRIYDEFKISCQPVAINSGYVWPKIGKKRVNKEIIISILEPIVPGLSKKEFTSKLEKEIYAELDKLN